VPGFRRGNGRVRFVDAEGLLVPVRDLAGRIIALKLRHAAAAEGGSKYVWISSAAYGGPSPGSPPHVPLGTPTGAPEIRITEGELKADVAFVLSGLPTIGAPGVTNWRPCVAVAQAMGAGTVRVAFDQDSPPKPGVIKDLKACVEGLMREGIEVKLETWDNDGGQFKGIDDLLAAGRTPDVIAGQAVFACIERLEAAVGTGVGDADTDDWLPADPAEDVAEFPLEVFPEPLRQFANEAAASLQCPADFITMPMLAIAGAAIGVSRVLRVRDGFEEGPRFYGAIVARAGTAKSPALRAACVPVYAEQSRLREKFRQDKATFEEAIDTYEAARKERSRTAEPVGPAIEKPAKPAMTHLFVGDVTTEALSRLLEKNARGIIMIRDEITGWVLGLNQYRGGRGTDRQFFLSCWSGEPAKTDRVSNQDEPLIVANPFLCVIGCIPPSKLPELDAESNGEDGFVHRILFSYPKTRQHRRWTNSGLTPQARQLWTTAVEKLYALRMGIDENETPLPVAVRFTPEAGDRWAAWYDAHFAETESRDFPDMLVGPWSKMVGYTARLALIVHLLREVCGEVATDDVDDESLVRAIKLIKYFQSHARVVYARLHAPQQHDRLRKVLDWVRAHGGECSPTHLSKNNVAGVVKTSEAEAVMKELEDLNYGRCDKRKAGNNKNVLWFVAKAA
jgi:hypothetical protein